MSDLQFFYQRTSTDYGEKFMQEGEKKIPSYSEIVGSMQQFRKAERELRNKSVAGRYSQQISSDISVMDQEKKKLDRNAVVGRKFPVKAESYRYPKSGLNCGSMAYSRASQEFGGKMPSEYEMPTKSFGRSNKYTTSFNGGTCRYFGLNCNVVHSKTHRHYDEF